MKYVVIMLIILTLIAGCAKQAPADNDIGDISGGGNMNLSSKKVVMIIAPEGFRDEEFLEPKAVLEKNSVKVSVASLGVDPAKGMLGAVADVEMDISEINVSKYDAFVFVGGSGASVYFNDEVAQGIAKSAYDKGKIVAAICIAPTTLANAGILDGKKVTAYSSERGALEAKGATYTGKPLMQDGKIITANGPAAAKQFGEAIVKALTG